MIMRNSRRHVFAWSIAALCATACDFAQTDVALRRPLRKSAGPVLSERFSVRYTGSYAVSLEFPWPIEDAEVATLVNQAAAYSKSESASTVFDFSWEVRESDRLIAEGSGRKGPSGVVDTSDSGLGGGPPKTRALAFGKFNARKGGEYTLRFTAGSEFGRVAGALPILKVEHWPPM
jgi:hypothetical protein